MSIGNPALPTEVRHQDKPVLGWRVPVETPLTEIIPASILRAWVACESFQRQNPDFWPENRALAERMGVRQITSAQRLLLRLEDLGILERCYHPENRRKLILLRRTGDPLTPEEWAEMKKSAEARREARRAPQDFGPDTSREMCQGTSKQRCQENKTKGEENRNVTMPSFPEKITSPPPAPAPAPLTPPAPPPPATPTPRMAQELPPTTPTASRAPQPVRPIRDELKALPGAEPSRVRSLAWRLAYHLKDVASIGFFIMVLGLVAKGLAPVERLLAAFVVADRSRGSARKPGAIFASTWNGWQAPPKPSEINRPVYYQAARPPEPPPPPEPEPTSRETISEEMLCDWETWASMPRHPLAGYARKMLAAYHAGELPREGP